MICFFWGGEHMTTTNTTVHHMSSTVSVQNSLAAKGVDSPTKITLVIDDEDDVLHTFERFFERIHKSGHYCNSAQQGIAYYKEHWQEIDCVFVDLVMPEMDGKTVLRTLQTLNPQVKVFLCSGYADEIFVENILQEGATGFVGKPFTLTEIQNCVAA
jgi:CheY-like chemotaxis protein